MKLEKQGLQSTKILTKKEEQEEEQDYFLLPNQSNKPTN